MKQFPILVLQYRVTMVEAVSSIMERLLARVLTLIMETCASIKSIRALKLAIVMRVIRGHVWLIQWLPKAFHVLVTKDTLV